MALINVRFLFAGLCGVLVSSLTTFAQHGHLNVGATGTNQNDQLIWANGAIFAANSGFVRTMSYTNAGRFSNTYNQNISVTALAQTTANGGPVANAPALGSFIVAEIVSVKGPQAGAFQFWETNSQAGAPGLSVPSGTTAGTFQFDLSDKLNGAGTAGSDPFGHIHSRRMGITKPGRYTVGFRAIDISTNGQNGGPIHRPTEVLEINFENLTSIDEFRKTGELMNLTFKAEPDMHYEVEYSDDPSATSSWTTAGAAVAGSNSYLTLPVPNASAPRRFYRLKAEHDDSP